MFYTDRKLQYPSECEEARRAPYRNHVNEGKQTDSSDCESARVPGRGWDFTPTRSADTLGPAEFREAELEERLDELVTLARRVFGVAGAGLMLLSEDGTLAAAGASDNAAAALERAQQQTGVGPGLQSTQAREIVVVEDLAADLRWPEVAELVADFDVRGVLSAPITLDQRAIGNLNLFDRNPRVWTDADLDRARSLAGVIATWLRVAVDSHSSGRLLSQLQWALDSGEPTGPTA